MRPCVILCNSHISLCDYSVMTLGMRGFYISRYPQKKKMPMNFFETLPECSLPSIVAKKKTIKMIDHHSRL